MRAVGRQGGGAERSAEGHRSAGRCGVDPLTSFSGWAAAEAGGGVRGLRCRHGEERLGGVRGAPGRAGSEWSGGRAEAGRAGPGEPSKGRVLREGSGRVGEAAAILEPRGAAERSRAGVPALGSVL